jgi:hypothetical protein
MKTVNPLHIIGLLFVLLLFLFMQLKDAKQTLLESKEMYTQTLELATSLKAFNEVYSDKKGVRKSISLILKQHSLKAANIKQSIGKSSIIIRSQSMDKRALNSLMSKLLNGSYNMHSLHIKRLSESKVSFTTEIRW